MSARVEGRRGFLRGLVSLPLIGGGVTLIGKPAAAVPLVQAAAIPDLLGDPRQRARYAWEAFAGAMRDITADAHGWYVQGGERPETIGCVQAAAWCQPKALRLLPMFPDRPEHSGLIDRLEDISL